MFPMVATVAEFDQAKAIVERTDSPAPAHARSARTRCISAHGRGPGLLYQLDELLTLVDFLSSARTTDAVHVRCRPQHHEAGGPVFDAISPPFLRALKSFVDPRRAWLANP